MGAARADEIVRDLWGLCSVLRDEGVTYHEYLSELSYPLFLKLASTLSIETKIPAAYRWQVLRAAPAGDALAAYRRVLAGLAEAEDPFLRAVFNESATRIRTKAGLSRFLAGIDAINWGEIAGSTLGDVYEGLIQKSAQESRYGAGQYFTPRPLVEAIVAAVQPTSADTVYDPAAGTAGFLIAAGAATRSRRHPSLHGVELATDVHRLALMNLMLHGMRADLYLGDALTSRFPPKSCTVCLTNPPFGVKGSVTPEEAEHLDFPTSSKQLAFLQHVYARLAPAGRAAVVVPDNVLFEEGVAKAIRTHLLDTFNLHTILRLPTGIFYATGVKASVLFFQRPMPSQARTQQVWIYDLRNGGKSFTRRKVLQREDFEDFLEAYGSDPNGNSPRQPSARFYSVDREVLRSSGDRLDLGIRDAGPSEREQEGSPLAALQLLKAEIDAVNNAVSALIDLVAMQPGDPRK
ncbi:N-6 DNA methylase [Micromonospora sp. NPDC005707]|uniref:HsdM family class I SAM-dependent methyltransferase n=1 Tax=Micromonospora sp. NPDC005707 TaxID=3157050 RepID=UPI0033E285F7